MKIPYFILVLITMLYSCGESNNSQVLRLKLENDKLKNSLDSLNDYMQHSLVIYHDDMPTQIGTLAFGKETIDSKSEFHLSTYLWMVKLSNDYEVKWSIDQKGGEIDNSSNFSNHVTFKNLKPGNHTFTGSYEIYLKNNFMYNQTWQKELYVEK